KESVEAQSELAAYAKLARELIPADPGSPDAQVFRAELLKSLSAQFHRSPPSSWDEFVQYYLRLVALYKSQLDADGTNSLASVSSAHDKQVAQLLTAIRDRLSFPVDSKENFNDSPASSEKPSPILRVLRSGFNSPFDFDPAGIPKNLHSMGFPGKNLYDLF